MGRLRAPGDKSVTHRALLLGAVAEGTTSIHGALRADDCRSTAGVVAALGAEVVDRNGVWELTGVEHVRSPEQPLDCGNAGTLARLLLGLLAPRAGAWTLDGDASLRGRPMARVTDLLAGLGADVAGDRLPLTLRGARLRGGEVHVALPSAQVKSALLLAALGAESPLRVVQPVATRDHTERMLARFGVDIEREPGAATVTPGRPRACRLDVPGDPSSAAFPLVAALLVPGSDVWVDDVGLWPRRTGFLRALERAGADVMVMARRDTGSTHADPCGTVRARCGERLRAFEIAPEDVPDLVDELPVLALAAAVAEGTSRFAGLAELRVKESDRVAAMAELLASLSVPVDVDGDELRITGVERLDGRADLLHVDHRLALCAAVADHAQGHALPAALPTAAVSYPDFCGALARLVAG